MRWRVTILRQSQTENDFGEQVDAWTELRTVRAEKIHRTATESFTASQRAERRTVTFRVWYSADILATDRLVCDGLTYDVKGIEEIGFRRGLEITAEYREG
jgi:SPP1 family predicted phage head-tail adaptor